MAGVVGGENVAAEVAGRVAPHGVHMVGVALAVVVFDQQPQALDPVVVRPVWLGAAGPGEVQLPGGAGNLGMLALGGVCCRGTVDTAAATVRRGHGCTGTGECREVVACYACDRAEAAFPVSLQMGGDRLDAGAASGYCDSALI